MAKPSAAAARRREARLPPPSRVHLVEPRGDHGHQWCGSHPRLGPAILVLLMTVVLLTAGLDMLLGSASAKWAALAPAPVPMLMRLGISPEMTTAAYRLEDSSVNTAAPLMPNFALVLGFCQRWRPGFGGGGQISAMLPYSAAMMSAGVILVGLRAALELPLGPQADVHYSPPQATSSLVPS